MPRWLFWLISGTIVLVGTTATIALASQGWPADAWHAAPILGSLLVAVGWIVTSQNAIKNSQREHTINEIAASKESDKKCWAIIRKYLPQPDAVLALPGESHIYPSADHELYEAVDDLLNDFDFIALGATKGVYDDAMLQSALELDFVYLYELAAHYISYTQESEKDSEIWRDFCKLTAKWQRKEIDSAHRQKANLRRAVRLAWRFGYLAGMATRLPGAFKPVN